MTEEENAAADSMEFSMDPQSLEIAMDPGMSDVPDLKKWDYYKFGSYFQENSNSKTPIEWLVLKKNGHRVFLISREVLDCRQYHHEGADVTWESCDLRKWLNDEFFRNAFSEQEQKKIAVTALSNAANSKYGTSGGNDTEDRIFCLSVAELEKYFRDPEARKCVPSAYAKECGVWQTEDVSLDGKGCSSWWLRSPGSSQKHAALVFTDGNILLNGTRVNSGNYAVRPAMWISLV